MDGRRRGLDRFAYDSSSQPSPAQPSPSTWEPGLFHWFFVVISGPWCQGSGVRHAAAVHTWGLVGPSETDTGGGFPDMNKLRLQKLMLCSGTGLWDVPAPAHRWEGA